MPTLTLTLSVDLPPSLFSDTSIKELQNPSLPIDTSAKVINFHWNSELSNTPSIDNLKVNINLPQSEPLAKQSSKPLPTIPTGTPSNGLQLIQSPPTPQNANNNSKFINVNGKQQSLGRTSLPPRNRSGKIQKVSLTEILDNLDDKEGVSMSRRSTSSSTASLTRLTPQGPRPLLDDSPPLSYPLEVHKSAPSSIPSGSHNSHRRSSSLAANFGKSTLSVNSGGNSSKKGFTNTIHNLLKKSSINGLSHDSEKSPISSTKIGDLSRLQSKSECPSLGNSSDDLAIQDEIKPRRKSLDLTTELHEPIIRPRHESLNKGRNCRPLTVYWAEAPSKGFGMGKTKSEKSSPKIIPNRSVSLAKKRTNNNSNSSNGSTSASSTFISSSTTPTTHSKSNSIFARNKSHKSVSSIFSQPEDRPSSGLEFIWEEVNFNKQQGSILWSKLEHLSWFKNSSTGGKQRKMNGFGSEEDEGLVINDVKATSPSKNTDMRYLVSLELLTTESSYLSSLEYIINAYHKPLIDLSPSPISPSDLNQIFHTLVQLLKLSQTLEFILGTVIDESIWNPRTSCIGPIFLDLKDDWNLILKFCKNYSSVKTLVKNLLQSNEKFKKVVEQGNLKSPSKQNLLELIILPVQRLTRYSLLLTAIKKHTSQSHPDYPYLCEAIQLLDNLGMEANLSNTHNPTTQNSKATQELHLSIKNCPPTLTIPVNSKLVQTEAHDLILDRRVKMFIFDNTLLIAVARKKWQLMKTGDRWKYLVTLNINNLYLVKVTDATGKLMDPPIILVVSMPGSPSLSSLNSFDLEGGLIRGGSGGSSNGSESGINLNDSIAPSTLVNGSINGGDGQYLALQFGTGKVFREWLNFVGPKLTTYTY